MPSAQRPAMLPTRTAQEAKGLDGISEAELCLVAALEEPFQAWDRKADRTVLVQSWDRERKNPSLTKHGVCGHAWVRETPDAVPWRVRVHFCSQKKCGVKFDNRVEPFLFCGVFLQRVFDPPAGLPVAPAGDDNAHPDAPAGDDHGGSHNEGAAGLGEERLDAPAEDVAVDHLEAIPGHPEEVPDPVVLEQESCFEYPDAPAGGKCLVPAGDHGSDFADTPIGETDSDLELIAAEGDPCLVGWAPSAGEVPRSPAISLAPTSPALSEPAVIENLSVAEVGLAAPVLLPPRASGSAQGCPPLEDARLDYIPSGACRRIALIALLEQEIGNWRANGFYLPLLAFMIFCYEHRRSLFFLGDSGMTDVFCRHAPWALPHLTRDGRVDEPIVPAGADDCCAIACQTVTDDDSGLTSVQWPRSAADEMRMNHYVICAKKPGSLRLIPHIQCGGNWCGGAGAPCMGALMEVCDQHGMMPLCTVCDGDCAADVCCFWAGLPRNIESRSSMRGALADMMQARVHDDQWLELFDVLMQPDWRPLSQVLERRDGPCAGMAIGSLRDSGACASPDREETFASEELHQAIRWAAGIGGKEGGVDEMEVNELIQAIPPDKQRLWLERWRAHVAGGEPSPSVPAGATSKPLRKGKYRSYVFHQTAKMAKEFLTLHPKKPGVKQRLKRGAINAFLTSKGWDTTKATKDHFGRMLKAVREEPIVTAGVNMRDRVAKKLRRRRIGKQGAHLVKAPVIREQLFEWFCSVRGRIKGRLPVQVLRSKAMALRLQCMVAAASAGVRVAVPRIQGTTWLWRWRRTYNVSLRKPSKRWKVPRKVLLVRLKILWLNLIRVRCLAMLSLGYDLEADNADQKPFHLNESGSKDLRTLEVKGARVVTLKEIHSETRARWTAQTFCTSSRRRAEATPFVEVLFKGGEGILRDSGDYVSQCPACSRVRMTVQVSNSGSYRMEHILFWMDRALKRGPGDDNRWRILLLDVYRAHMGDPVYRLAWKHRYVLILVGGGCTGVVQVNDTHLHALLSAAYIELELADLFDQHERNPAGCPRRHRNDCARDLALVWSRPLLHLRASEGFVHNMLTAALDGSDDGRAGSECAAFWQELNMTEERSKAIDQVCSEWEAGRLEWSFDVVYGLVEAFPLTGHQDQYVEGQEDEGEHVQDEEGAPWDDRENPSPANSDDDDDGDLGGGGRPSRQRGRRAHASAPAGLSAAPAAQPSEPVEDLSAAQRLEVAHHEHRLNCLQQAFNAAEGEPQVQLAIANVRSQLLREATGRSQRDSKVSRAVRRQAQLARDVDAQRARRLDEERRKREAEVLAQEQASSYIERRMQELVEREQKLRQEAASEKDKAQERRDAIRSASVGFDLASLGQMRESAGGDFHRRNRMKFIDRVFALGDQRPAEMEANWKIWIQRLDDYGRMVWKMRWAAKLRMMMVEVLEQLQAGDSRAAIKWHRNISREWGLEKGRVMVPAASAPRASGSAGSERPNVASALRASGGAALRASGSASGKDR